MGQESQTGDDEETINTGETQPAGQTGCPAAPHNMQTLSRLLLLLLAWPGFMVAEVSGACQCLDQCLLEHGDVVVPADGPTRHGGKYVVKEQSYYCSVLNDGSCSDVFFSGNKARSYQACAYYVPPPANARPDKQWRGGGMRWEVREREIFH